MKEDVKKMLQQLLAEHKRLGIAEQLDYTKFYLYSIITHSTAIEGSTVTEVEAQLLFDEGITSSTISPTTMSPSAMKSAINLTKSRKSAIKRR